MSAAKLRQRCIICGEEIPSHNRDGEHVIPEWLINLTGDPNRSIIETQADADGSTSKRQYFNYIKVPVHATCNQATSSLQSRVKEVVAELCDHSHLTAEGLAILFSWCDHQRLVRWHHILLRNKETFQLRPHLSVRDYADRVDSVLVIVRSDHSDAQGVYPWTLRHVFMCCPRSWLLVINNIAIIQLNGQGLLGRLVTMPSGSPPLSMISFEAWDSEMSREGLNQYRLSVLGRQMLESQVAGVPRTILARRGSGGVSLHTSAGAQQIEPDYFALRNGALSRCTPDERIDLPSCRDVSREDLIGFATSTLVGMELCAWANWGLAEPSSLVAGRTQVSSLQLEYLKAEMACLASLSEVQRRMLGVYDIQRNPGGSWRLRNLA